MDSGLLSVKCLSAIIKRDYSLLNSIESNNSKCSYNPWGLDDIELCLLHSYVGQISKWLNKDLLDNGIHSDECEKIVLEYINSGLNKLPNHNNEIVFRNGQYNISESEYIQIMNFYKNKLGKVIRFPSLLSTSKGSWGRKITYKIQTSINSKSTDLNIIKPSNISEQEVLFQSGTCFKVIIVSENVIELEEVDCGNVLFTNVINSVFSNYNN